MKKFTIAWLIALTITAISLVAIFFGLGFFLSPQDKIEKSDVIVVISGGRTTIRAERGIELYKQGYSDKLLFSGAALDDGPSNAAAMAEQALNAGVTPDNILPEEDSQTTYQNAVNSKRIIDQMGYKKIILVTSPYHQRRANMTFEKVFGKDYEIDGVSAIDDRWSKRYWYRSGFAYNISISELRKIVYIWVTGSYQ